MTSTPASGFHCRPRASRIQSGPWTPQSKTPPDASGTMNFLGGIGMKTFGKVLAGALLATTMMTGAALAQSKGEVQMLHWWTSGGEAARSTC